MEQEGNIVFSAPLAFIRQAARAAAATAMKEGQGFNPALRCIVVLCGDPSAGGEVSLFSTDSGIASEIKLGIQASRAGVAAVSVSGLLAALDALWRATPKREQGEAIANASISKKEISLSTEHGTVSVPIVEGYPDIKGILRILSPKDGDIQFAISPDYLAALAAEAKALGARSVVVSVAPNGQTRPMPFKMGGGFGRQAVGVVCPMRVLKEDD